MTTLRICSLGALVAWDCCAFGQIQPRTTTTIRTLTAAASRAQIIAAPVRSGLSRDVRLRWYVTSGWIPAGGFRVYRGAGTGRVRVFPPDAPSVRVAPTPIPTEIAGAIQLAKSPLTGDTTLFPTPPPPPQPTVDIFRARMNKANELLSRPQLTDQKLRNEVSAVPGYKSFLDDLATDPPRAVALSADPTRARTLAARRSIMISALARPTLSDELGFGVTDPNPPQTGQVTYSLVEANASGQESPLDTVTIDMAEGVEPPQPTDLLAAQVGEGVVDLRWTRLSQQQEAALGIARYQVSRQVGTAAPTILTPEPLSITDRRLRGKLVEPIAFFSDRKAPHGPVKYSVVLIDGFGRHSDAGTITLNVIDLRTPPPPAPVRARVGGGTGSAVTVLWQVPAAPTTLKGLATPTVKSLVGTALYNIYRIDEDLGGQPVRLTPAPIPGSTLDSLSDIERRSIATTVFGTPTQQLSSTTLTKQLSLLLAADRGFRRFVDTTAERDRRYRYIVRSTFSFNQSHESPDSASSVLDVPSTVAPAAPGSLTAGSFQPDGGKPTTTRSYLSRPGSFTPVSSSLTRTTIGGLPTTTIPNLSGALAAFAKPKVAIGGRIKLTWAPVTNVRKPLYRIYREPQGLPAYKVEVGQTEKTTFTDSLARSQRITYVYTVTAQSRWNVVGAPSAAVPATVPATLAPSTPIVIAVTPDSSGGGIHVRFKSNPAEEDVKTYRIFRKALPRSISRQSLLSNDLQQIMLRRNLPPTPPPGPGSPPKLPPPPTTSPESDSGYTLVREVGPKADLSEFDEIDAEATDPSMKYFYKIECVNEAKFKSDRTDPMGSEMLRIGLAAPASVTATHDQGAIALSWQKSEGATGYVVLRATGQGGKLRQVSGVLKTTNFRDASVLRRKTYIYKVMAVDDSGNVSAQAPEAGAMVTLQENP